MSIRDISRIVILGCLFITPFIALYVAEGMFFPFITGKNFTFRILVEVMLGAWLILMFVDAKYRPRFSYVLLAAGAFLGVLTVADMLGANPYRSFWSNYERMEGLVTLAHLFLYFLIAGSVLLEESLWKWFLRTSLGASTIICFNAVAQLLGTAQIHQSSTRLDATLGNSAYLGVFTLFHVFIATFLYVRDGRKNVWRWLYVPVALLNAFVLFYTQTRGAMIGLVGGLFLAALLVALFDKEHPKLKKVAIGSLLAGVLMLGLFFIERDSSFVRGNTVLSRLASISLTENTVESRFMIWKMSWQGFKEHPVLGWGQDNFIYVFAKYYNPQMYNQEPWFDRSHDVFFDWLIAGGALGLLSYLSLFGAILYYLWFSKRTPFSVPERAILTGLLAGYFCHNIFVFDNLTSYLLFFAILAYVHSMHADAPAVQPEIEEKKSQKKKKTDASESQDVMIVFAVVTLLTFSLIYYINIRNINANLALIDALRNPLTRDTKGQAKIAIEDVLKLKLFGTSEAREQLGQLAFQALDPRLDQNLRKQIFDLTNSEFQDELKKDPNNLRYRSFVALLYSRYGQYQLAEDQFKAALNLSPRRQSTWIDLGTMYLSTGNYPQALQAFKSAHDLEPSFGEARLYYAMGLIYAKEFDNADNILKPLRGSYDDRLIYDSRLVNAYGENRRFDKVVELLGDKIAAGAMTGRDYISLGVALNQLNQKQKAIEAFKTAATIDPSLKEKTDPMIKEITGS